ncbi:ATP-binding protein [Bacillus bingmayongensis]|uniref:ATP-binding protein n=1 Tax=Bacillus bingmayongensis TaxID=1150157 RepID=UPI001C8D704E|nr:ATP-binding protein [Bacillus bingmayongensis]MBY0596493.1 ATP-binding protein [Bacillus bingmayongensis]
MSIKKFLLKGAVMDADYKSQQIEDYQGNPLIEALPEIYSETKVIKKLVNRPLYKEEEKTYPSHLRMHMVQRVYRDFFQPLSIHLEVEQRVSRIIRDGYLGRSPLTPNYAYKVRKDAYHLIVGNGNIGGKVLNASSSGFAIVGISGIGKSSTLEKVLNMYPQVVIHTSYQEQPLHLYQVVWLKMDCPHDGSIKGLCLNFLSAMDEILGGNYYKKHGGGRKTVDELLPIISQIAAVHCLGVLVIDEIQNLNEAKSGGSAKMLNFFVQLVNTIGVPVILIGTYKASSILDGEFRNARRVSGQGDLIWSRMQNDDEWDYFLKGLWCYQWTSKFVEYNVDFKEVMYYESQGISDIAVKLFMLAQWRCIDTNKPNITPSIIKSVARDRLQLLQPALTALRTGVKGDIEKLGDIFSKLETVDLLNEIEEKLKQKDRLELLKQEMDYNTYEPLIQEVGKWLIEGGIEEVIASQCAKDVVSENLDKLTKVDLKQLALKHALSKLRDGTVKSKPKMKKLKATYKEADDLRLIYLKAKEKKILNYDALKVAGFIKQPNEFLTGQGG